MKCHLRVVRDGLSEGVRAIPRNLGIELAVKLFTDEQFENVRFEPPVIDRDHCSRSGMTLKTANV